VQSLGLGLDEKGLVLVLTVMTLCEPYLNAGRTICTDNYYTSVPLARKLLQSETHLIGTLRANRKYLPADMTHIPDSNLVKYS